MPECYTLKLYSGVKVKFHTFLTSALAGDSGHFYALVTPALGNHWPGGWVVPQVSLDMVGGGGRQTLPAPLRNQSLNISR
jgi:hypothetical protein